MCVPLSIYIYMYMHVYMCIHIYVYIYIYTWPPAKTPYLIGGRTFAYTLGYTLAPNTAKSDGQIRTAV